MGRVPFSSNDGYPFHTSFYDRVITNINRELEARLQARSISRGVATGLVVTDASTGGGVTGVNITSGYAYTDDGRRTYLSGEVLLNLDGGDIGKYVTIFPSVATGLAEAHPVDGTINYLRQYDTATVSAITSPNQASGHTRLAYIEDVQPGPLPVAPTVTLRSVDLTDRDVLIAAPVFPYVTVGPVGSDADFTGSDGTPFLEAFTTLKSLASGGVVYVKRGRYDMSNSGGYTVSGFNTLHIIGEGKGTNLRFTGASNSEYRFWNNDEVIIENMSMYTNTGTSNLNGWLDFKDTGIIRFLGNYCSGGIDNTNVMTLVSGIDIVWIEDCYFTHRAIVPFRIYNHLGATSGWIGEVHFVDNYCSAAFMNWNWTIDSINFNNNFLIDSSVDQNKLGVTGTVNGVATVQSPSNTFNFHNNIWMGGKQTYASPAGATRAPQVSTEGAMISSNQFYMDDFSTVGVVLLDTKSGNPNGADGRYSSITNNVFYHSRSGAATCVATDNNSSGVVIVGNTFFADGTSASQKAIAATGADSIVDGNISDGFGTASTAGTNTWMGSSDNTSNITG